MGVERGQDNLNVIMVVCFAKYLVIQLVKGTHWMTTLTLVSLGKLAGQKSTILLYVLHQLLDHTLQHLLGRFVVRRDDQVTGEHQYARA